MSTVFKGLTRPALIRGLGVPLYPFLGMCVICVLLGVWIHEAMYALASSLAMLGYTAAASASDNK